MVTSTASRPHRAASPLTVALALMAFIVPLAAAELTQSAGACDGSLPLVLKRISSVANGFVGAGTFETLTYDSQTKTAIVVEARPQASSSILFVDLKNPSAPAVIRRIAMGPSAGEAGVGVPNSASARNGLVAVSLDADPFTAPGSVRLYRISTGKLLASVALCAMPDMITWSRDGKYIYAACEGEPASQANTTNGSDPNYGDNPTGKFGIVRVRKDKSAPGGFTLRAKTLDFQAYFDSISQKKYAALLAAGLAVDPRLPGGKATAAQDIEPEYIALNNKESRAYVTLQENNAVAVIALKPHGKERIVDIWPLGLKPWTPGKAALDPSDRDSKAQLRNYANVYSQYQPDTIVCAKIGRKEYLFLANEGDSKEEGVRVGAIGAANLDPKAFPNATALVANTELGRLNVKPFCGLKGAYDNSKPWNQQGPYNALCAYGSRSFSILDASNGRLVYDSGDELERRVLAEPLASTCFNCDRASNAIEDRSDNAGPEPEAIDVFSADGRYYAAVGLERMSGLMLFDVTTPAAPSFVSYTYFRNFTAPATTPTAELGDLGPEGVLYVPGGKSGSGKPLVLVSHEVSGTMAVHEVQTCAK